MIKHNIKSVRTFIGAKNFGISRQFYSDLGFNEYEISGNMSYFNSGQFGFYLQDYYVKDWIENSMVFLEVDDVELYLEQIKALALPTKYEGVKVSGIRDNDWGREFFVHDPSGVLWHFGAFY